MRLRGLLFGVACVVLACSAHAAVIYVDNNVNVPGPRNGSSWANAFVEIQQGIDAAAALPGPYNEVWVADGNYTGVGAGPVYYRTEPWGNVPVPGSLILRDNVHVYGGFGGYNISPYVENETATAQRAVRQNLTTIDGATARSGSPAYHVVAIGKLNEPVLNTRLDGFTIYGGAATGIATGDPATEYHTWRGAGIYNWLSMPIIANCYFYNNIARMSGGGMANESREIGGIDYAANAELINCVFHGNEASRLAGDGNPVKGGGAIFNNSGPGVSLVAPVFRHCTLADNVIGSPGAGSLFGRDSREMYNWASGPVIEGSILWANGGVANGIQDEGGSVASATYSDISRTGGGLWPGIGNINGNPGFVGGSGIDPYNLAACGVCTDTANPASLVARDIRGVPRPLNKCTAARNDMGAYEYTNVGPTAVCAPHTVQLDGAGNGSMQASDINGGSSGEGGIWKILAAKYTFNCGDLGTPSVMLTVFDFAARSATCNATVTVADSINPTVTCQNATVQLDGAGNAAIVPANVEASSGDNCGVTGRVVNPSAFTCANIGNNTVTLTVSDASGNSASCQATVTVQDTTPPTASCQNYTATLDGSGSAAVTPANIDNGSADNCGIATRQINGVASLPYGCADRGNHVVTLTVIDGVGLSSTCLATVTVQDITPPTATCQNIIVPLDAVGAVSIAENAVNNGSLDNCGIASYDTSVTDFDCGDVGDNIVTLTVTDTTGNSSTCLATVTVQDTIPPTAQCATSINVQLDGTGNASIVPADVDAGTTDNCLGLLLFSVVPNTFNCSQAGTGIPVVLTATDVGGNSDTCTCTVNVQDIAPPLATCQNLTVQLDGTGNASIAEAAVDNGSTDNCGIVSYDTNVTDFDCTDLGDNPVVLTLLDGQSNSATCQATVTIEDSINPVAVCRDITFDIATGTINPNLVDNGSTDNCAVTNKTVVPDTFGCAEIGTVQQVVLTVEDASGNSDTCTANVNVIGSLSCILQPPSTVRIYTGDNASYAVSACGGSGFFSYTWFYDANMNGTLEPGEALNNGGVHPRDSGCHIGIVTGGGTSTLTLTTCGLATSGQYRCRLTAAGPPIEFAFSGAATLAVVNAVDVTSPAAPYSEHRNTGGQLVLNVTATGGHAPLAYQWQWNGGGGPVVLVNGAHPGDAGSTVSTATTATLTVNISATPAGTGVAGTYVCLVTDALYPGDPRSSDTSPVGTVTVTELLAVSDPVPTPQDIYVLGGATFTVTASGGDGNYSYQWYQNMGQLSNGAPFSGVGTAALQISNASLAENGSYDCKVIDTSPDPDAWTQNSGELNVYDHLTIAAHPAPVPDPPNVGDIVTMTVQTDGGIPNLAYAWEWDDLAPPADNWAALSNGPHPSGSGSSISTSGTATLTLVNVELGDRGLYRVTITDNQTKDVVTSNPADMTNMTNFMNASLPANTYAYTGEALVLTLKIFAGIPPYTVQWQQNGVPFGAPHAGVVGPTDTLDLGTADAADAADYDAEVSDSSGGVNPNVFSNVDTLAVADPTSIGVDPVDVFVHQNAQAAVFSVTGANGHPPYTYVWRQGGVALPPAEQPNAAVLDLGPQPLASDGLLYDVIVTDQGSNAADPNGLVFVTTNATSSTATLNVGNPITYVSGLPADTRAYTDDAPFTLSASPIGGINMQGYTWSREEIATSIVDAFGPFTNGLPNTASLEVDPAVLNGDYNFWVTITEGITGGDVMTDSDSALVEVADHLSFTTPLAPTTDGIIDQDLTLQVEVDGGLGDITYVWSKEDGTKAYVVVQSGAEPSLDFTPLVEADAGDYQVEASDEGSSFTPAADSIVSQTTLSTRAGVPAAGLLGLAALAAITALGGAMALRRRDK